MKKYLILSLTIFGAPLLILLMDYLGSRRPYYVEESAGNYYTRGLLTQYEFQYIDQNFSDYKDRNIWIQKYLQAENIFSTTLLKRLNKFQLVRVAADIQHLEYGSLIVTYVGKDSTEKCMHLPYVKEGAGRSLYKDFKGVLQFAGNVVARCYNSGRGLQALELSSFKDFVYYDLLSCYGLCEEFGGVIFRSKMTNKEKATILPLVYKDFKHRYLPGFDENDANSSSIEVEIFFSMDEDRFLQLRYKDNFYGEIRSSYLIRKVKGSFEIVQTDIHTELFFLFGVPLY